jgi:hypothetical protein
MVTQTNLTVRVTLPSTPASHGVLRYRYLSNNPLENNHGTVFYNCADIELISSGQGEKEQAQADRGTEERLLEGGVQRKTTPAYSCTGPPSWDVCYSDSCLPTSVRLPPAFARLRPPSPAFVRLRPPLPAFARLRSPSCCYSFFLLFAQLTREGIRDRDHRPRSCFAPDIL